MIGEDGGGNADGSVEEVGVVVCCEVDECGLQGKGKGEREREREGEGGLGHEVVHGFFEVGDSRLVLGRVVVVFRYWIASIFLCFVRRMVQDRLLTYSALSSTSTVPDFVQPKIQIRDAVFEISLYMLWVNIRMMTH